MIKNIVFDLGGVLIDWNPRYLYQKVFESRSEMEYFLSEVCHSRWNETLDAGRPFQEACDELAIRFPTYQKEIHAYRSRWSEMLGGPIKGSVSILQLLASQNYRLFSITNWSAETFPIAWQSFSFLSLFEDIVVSGVEKIIKPSPELYRVLLKRTAISAQECVFIDDNYVNVEGARDVGMQALHFLSPEQLREDLKKMNIIV